MPPLLLELWREQHPLGHEQIALDFKASLPVAKSAPLFRETASREPLRPGALFVDAYDYELESSPLIY
jgi:hypothetical protein